MALTGVILLLALYVFTLVLAFVGNANTLPLLKASLYATIVVPVFIWAYSFIYKLLKKYYSHPDENQEKDKGRK